MLKAAVLCHGKNDGFENVIDLMRALALQRIGVVTVSDDARAEPSLVLDLTQDTSYTTILQNHPDKFDIVILMHCPVFVSGTALRAKLVEQVHTLLKPGAALYVNSVRPKSDSILLADNDYRAFYNLNHGVWMRFFVAPNRLRFVTEHIETPNGKAYLKFQKSADAPVESVWQHEEWGNVSSYVERRSASDFVVIYAQGQTEYRHPTAEFFKSLNK